MRDSTACQGGVLRQLQPRTSASKVTRLAYTPQKTRVKVQGVQVSPLSHIQVGQCSQQVARSPGAMRVWARITAMAGAETRGTCASK